MRLIVCALVGDVAEIRRQGPADRLLGRLLDAGSYGTVEGLGPGPEGLTALVGADLERGAASVGVGVDRRSWPCRRSAAPEPAAAGGDASSLTVWEGWREVGDVAIEAAEAAWDRHLAAGGAVSVVVADAGRREPPLWVLCSYSSPSMGPVAAAVREDLWTTWLRLLRPRARVGVEGRDLLEEEDSADLDAAGEVVLTERLRQLYGE